MASIIFLTNSYHFKIQAKFPTPPHPITRIYDATVQSTPKQEKRMSALKFETKEAYQEYVMGMQKIPDGYKFCPTLAFPHNDGVVCFKDDIGVQIFSPASQFSVYKSKTDTRAASWWTDEIRKILRVIFRKHDKGESLGFMYEHTYMNTATGTITFTKLRQGACFYLSLNKWNFGR